MSVQPEELEPAPVPPQSVLAQTLCYGSKDEVLVAVGVYLRGFTLREVEEFCGVSKSSAQRIKDDLVERYG